LPWALVQGDHAPVAPPGRLRDAGLFVLQTLPVLTHQALPGDDWPAGSAEVDIRAADTPEAIAHHRALLALSFGIPDHMSRVVLPDVPPTPLLRLYVAYKNGEPVGSAALCEAAGLAGIYNVASHPRHRRAGIATALMRRAVEDARGRGLGTCVLQSSSAGVPLYTRLGFQPLSTYTAYGEN
jgi:GNAT superfamily N-acetyltransferase